VALDVGSDGDGVLFPPVAGIVPDAVAVDTQVENGEGPRRAVARARTAWTARTSGRRAWTRACRGSDVDDGYAAGRLQIYSVEEMGTATATCAVRCIGGVVYSGHQCSVDTSAENTGLDTSPLTLDWINVYGRLADFIKPPYSATVHLTGESVSALRRGVTVTSPPRNRLS
jgi:hypothetical protein